MNDNGTTGRDLPPYLGFQTLQNFLEALRQGIPQRIDRSMMRTLGGTVQKQLLHALHYLGLTSESGVPQEALKRLVSADGIERQQVWRQALEDAYPFLYGEEALGFDLSTATSGQLTEKFKTLGIQGDTVRKAEAFFLRAADEAGMIISPHIPKRISKPRRALGQLGKARNGHKPRKRKSIEDLQSVPTMINSSPPVYQSQASMTPQADARQALLQSLVTKMPEFDPKWDEQAQKRWLETFDRVAERLLAVPQETRGHE
ncbi:MAG: hypothetical protein ACRERE_42440 [Candidatus Entotheonellia bacterium]